MQNKSSKRIVALFAVISIISVIFFSSLYIIEHADHQCTGADCPVCNVIDQCLNNLKQIGGAAVVSICIVSLNIIILLINSNYDYIVSTNSLISQKIRMNN